MLRVAYIWFYHRDPKLVFGLMLLFVAIWSVIGAVFLKKRKIFGTAATVAFAGIILTITVFMRTSTIVYCDLIPFSSFIKSFSDIMFLRSNMMNIFLFIPFGAAVPYIIEKDPKRAFLITVFAGLCFSVGIELTQLIFHLGMTQTDDVICNTLGTAIGACAYPLSLLWVKLYRKRRSKDRAPLE